MTAPAYPETAEWPAVVQAIGSLVAIAIAIGITLFQRWSDRTDDAKRQIEHRRRLSMALIAEIEEAISASARQEETQRHTLSMMADARAAGVTVKDPGRFNSAAAPITDAVIYRQAAAAIGDFPTLITTNIVRFYSGASEIVRIAEVGANFETVLNVMASFAPRLRMNGEMSICMIKKWEQENFTSDATVTLSQDEVKSIAQKVGYPLDAVLKERGLPL